MSYSKQWVVFSVCIGQYVEGTREGDQFLNKELCVQFPVVQR